MLIDQIPLRTDGMATFPYSAGLEAWCTFETKFGDTVCMAVKAGNTLRVPRQMARLGHEDWRAHFDYQPFEPKKGPRSVEQAQLIAESVVLLQAKRDHVFEAPTGFGKCALKGETVLLYSGHLKKVEDVVVGDVLMGPDSTPRTVMSLGSGVTQAYELRTPRGEVLRFNEDHILCLEATSGGDFKGGTRCEVSLKDYLSWSKTKKNQFKLYKPDIVLFPEQKPPSVDAYVLGLLLGDGCLKNRVSLTTADPELVEAFTSECAKYNTTVDARGISYYSSSSMRGAGGEGLNPFIDAVRALGLMNTGSESKFVPYRYRMGSVEERLQLIAGLIDSDGHLNGGCFDYVSKSQQLANDLAFMCWSVGLAAVVSPCRKVCTNTGAENTYYRVVISGDANKIPTRLARKKAAPRKQKKSVLRHGFTVTDLGQQEYFGFQLDGDHQYLTGNFFVTHNTYCGCAIAAKIGQPTLIVVPKEDLVHEWTKTLVNLIGVDPKDIGYIQQDTCDYKGKKFVIGMVHSMVIEDRYPPEVYKAFGMMIVDEVHRMGADSFIRICDKVSALYRLGLSATCYRSDGKWKLIESHIGKVMVVGTAVPMSPKVIVKRTGWKIPMVKRFVDGQYKTVPLPHSPGRLMGVYKAMSGDVIRNDIIVEFVKQAYSAGRVIVVMADTIEMLTKLYQLVVGTVPATEMAYYIGKSSEAERKAAKETKRVVFATYKMCAEGTDAPRWDTLVMASPRADVKQSIGRVMRSMEGKKTPVIFDLIDDAPLLDGYARARQKQYFQVKADIVKV